MADDTGTKPDERGERDEGGWDDSRGSVYSNKEVCACRSSLLLCGCRSTGDWLGSRTVSGGGMLLGVAASRREGRQVARWTRSHDAASDDARVVVSVSLG